MDYGSFIRDVPDFPKKVIVFKDIMPLVEDAEALKGVVREVAGWYEGKGVRKVVAAEARGFVFAPAIAMELGCGFSAVRKKGKLPHNTRCITYELEYGTDTLCIHEDAVSKGEKVLVFDDLLATGGTAEAMVDLVESLGAEVVGVAFIIELAFLKGRERLKGAEVRSLIVYESE